MKIPELLLPNCFNQFQWIKFSGQTERNVTYFYAVSPPARRLRGDSSVLYIGRTENQINIRYKQETETNNTPGNSQATNIRTTHVIRSLRAHEDEVALFFTTGIKVKSLKHQVQAYGQLLQEWNKSHYLKEFKLNLDGTLDVEIEKFLLVHYTKEHLEVPPLNNRCG